MPEAARHPSAEPTVTLPVSEGLLISPETSAEPGQLPTPQRGESEPLPRPIAFPTGPPPQLPGCHHDVGQWTCSQQQRSDEDELEAIGCFCGMGLKQGPNSPHIHTGFPEVAGKYVYCPAKVLSLYRDQGMEKEMTWREFQASDFYETGKTDGPLTRTKSKVTIAAGVFFIVGGILCLIPVCWSAHVIIRNFYNPMMTDGQRRELGACLFIGWGSAGLLLIGGSLLCCQCPQRKDSVYPVKYSAPRSAARGGDYV
ncbi:uncharacterized protein LOC130191663 [Pseudoliparis swirei]|uniref:uncharacterized protein LOC130191663 n=1 Tax=Pseudoliparis swirei TaxID=2059687 RepID=UPI0024BEFE42|nr:uncharacterized protein LOC130191663 [Pseudoliparis swirei]